MFSGMFEHDLYLPQRGRWILRSKRRMRSPTQRVGVVGGDAKGLVTTFLYGGYLTFFDTFGVTDFARKSGSSSTASGPPSPLGKVNDAVQTWSAKY